MSCIIQINDLSKSFVLSHEGRESYIALRDVISQKAKKIFSFPSWMKPSEKITKEVFWALKDINFEIEQGERVGIIGRNGAGKSTLLKILSRITEPTSGVIKIKGRVASLLEVGTGFHPELTGRENIFLNGAILGMSRLEIKRHFDAIVDFAEIEKFLDTPVKRYSSGMYVRLAFAVAAHLEPEILIVDEVLAVGDAQFQKKCLGKMEDVSKNEGRTVLFVSHNMGVVSQLCNHAVLLQKGQVSFIGTPKKAIENYLGSQNLQNEYKAELKKSSKPNFIEHVIIKNGDGKPASNFSFNENILLEFSCRIGDYSPNLQIGIGMQDKLNNRVFTVLKGIDFFTKTDAARVAGSVLFPRELIAPNFYSFVFALWTKDGTIYDIAENICSFSIYDNGTELAQYEASDYGSIVIQPTWKNG